MYGFGPIKDSAEKQSALLHPSTGVPLTWRYFIRPTPAATCSSCLRLAYHPFGGQQTPFAQVKPGAPLRIWGLPYMEQWVLYQQLLNANNVTSATVVTACIAVSTTPRLPPTVVHTLTPIPPSRWDLLPHLPSPAAISPLSFSALTSKLMGHPSSSVHQYLLSVFRHGFRIDYDPSCIARLQFTSQNMQSVLQNTQVVDE